MNSDTERTQKRHRNITRCLLSPAINFSSFSASYRTPYTHFQTVQLWLDLKVGWKSPGTPRNRSWSWSLDSPTSRPPPDGFSPSSGISHTHLMCVKRTCVVFVATKPMFKKGEPKDKQRPRMKSLCLSFCALQPAVSYVLVWKRPWFLAENKRIKIRSMSLQKPELLANNYCVQMTTYHAHFKEMAWHLSCLLVLLPRVLKSTCVDLNIGMFWQMKEDPDLRGKIANLQGYLCFRIGQGPVANREFAVFVSGTSGTKKTSISKRHRELWTSPRRFSCTHLTPPWASQKVSKTRGENLQWTGVRSGHVYLQFVLF